MIGVCMWPPPAIFLGRRTDFATNAVATLLAGGRFGRMAVALVVSLLPPLPSRPSGSLPRFLQVAISVTERESEKGCKVMLTPKNSQKSLPAAIAHENDLLYEALKETFPASDPIAINVDLESPGARNGPNTRLSRSAQRLRKAS